jgi:hypothetical protein
MSTVCKQMWANKYTKDKCRFSCPFPNIHRKDMKIIKRIKEINNILQFEKIGN